MQNELKIFENPEFGRIRTMEINGEPYFVGKDVAEILGYKNTRDAVLKHVDDDNKRICCMNTTNGIHRLVAISEVGLFQLINNSKLLTIKNKEKILTWFKSLDFLNQISFSSRKEIEFINKLIRVLNAMKITYIQQYHIGRYKIDMYIPYYNLAIEFDENNHKNYSYESHEGRQKYIENTINCKFIRLSDTDTDEYNIGKVMKCIIDSRKIA